VVSAPLLDSGSGRGRQDDGGAFGGTLVDEQNDHRRGLRAALRYRLYDRLILIVKIAVPAASVVGVIYGIWGPVWPTAPKVSFRDTINASSTVLPFAITNPSRLFDLIDIQISCGIDLFYFKDADGQTGLVRDMSFGAPTINIPAHSTNNFPCTAADFLHVRADNSLQIGFSEGQNLATKPNAFRGPLEVLKMCLWISGSYVRFNRKEPFITRIFQWPAAPGQKQWIEGPINPDLPNEVWVPKGSKLTGAWGLHEIMDQPWRDKLKPGILQCSVSPPSMTISYRPTTNPP
jgi:hypothetical protein